MKKISVLSALVVSSLAQSALAANPPLTVVWASLTVSDVARRNAYLNVHGVLDRTDGSGRYTSEGQGTLQIRYPGRDWTALTADRANPIGHVSGWRGGYRGVWLYGMPSAQFDLRVCNATEGCSNPHSYRYLIGMSPVDGGDRVRVSASQRSFRFSVRDAEFGPYQFLLGRSTGTAVPNMTYTGYPVAVSCAGSTCTGELPAELVASRGIHSLTASGPMGSQERELYVEIWNTPTVTGLMPAKLGGSADVVVTLVMSDEYSVPQAATATLSTGKCASESIAIARSSERAYQATIPGRCLRGYGNESLYLDLTNWAGTTRVSIPYEQAVTVQPIPGPRPTVPIPRPFPTFVPPRP